jgi:hypothetical protein
MIKGITPGSRHVNHALSGSLFMAHGIGVTFEHDPREKLARLIAANR